jgi:hypothetical protein
MTERKFQKAIDQIALNAAKNGGPTIEDLLTAIIAGHDEAVETAEVLRLETAEKATMLAKELRLQHKESLDAITANKALVEKHLHEDINMTKAEFEQFIGGFTKKHEDRDAICAELHKEVKVMKENCDRLHAASPVSARGRPLDDPSDSQFLEHRESAFDQDIEDVRRLSKTTKRIIIAVLIAGAIFWLDILSRWASHIWLGYPN